MTNHRLRAILDAATSPAIQAKPKKSILRAVKSPHPAKEITGVVILLTEASRQLNKSSGASEQKTAVMSLLKVDPDERQGAVVVCMGISGKKENKESCKDGVKFDKGREGQKAVPAACA